MNTITHSFRGYCATPLAKYVTWVDVALVSSVLVLGIIAILSWQGILASSPYYFLGTSSACFLSEVIFKICSRRIKQDPISSTNDEFSLWNDLPFELQLEVLDHLPPLDLIHLLNSNSIHWNMRKYYEGDLLIAKFLNQFDYWYQVLTSANDENAISRKPRLRISIQSTLFMRSVLNARLRLSNKALELARRIDNPTLRIKAILAVVDIEVNPMLTQHLVDEIQNVLKKMEPSVIYFEFLIQIAKRDNREKMVAQMLTSVFQNSTSISAKSRFRILLKIAKLEKRKNERELVLDEALRLVKKPSWKQPPLKELLVVCRIEKRGGVKRKILADVSQILQNCPASSDILANLARATIEQEFKYQYLDKALEKASTMQDFLKIAQVEDRKKKKHSILDAQYQKAINISSQKSRCLAFANIIKLEDRNLVKKERTQRLIKEMLPPTFDPKIFTDLKLINELLKTV